MPTFEHRTVRIRFRMLTAAFIIIILNLGEIKEGRDEVMKEG
jgi:hypothetical protein